MIFNNNIKKMVGIVITAVLSIVAGLIMTEDEWINMGIFIVCMVINLIILSIAFKK